MAGKNYVENPFADPAENIESSRFYGMDQTNVNQSNVDAAALDNYNPFETTTLPAHIPNIGDISAPVYSSAQAQRLTTAELERRQRELDAKAAELARREEEQRIREQSRSMSHGVSEKNWPPLPSFCPCGPCFYQNIEVEIISEYQKIVKFCYYLWMIYTILLALNFLVALICFAGTQKAYRGSLFGVAILTFILCVPSSYVCWFRPLYKAFRNNSSINFFVFFFVFGAQIIFLIVQSIGFNRQSCGWIVGLDIVVESAAFGSIALVVACMFTGLTAVSVWYLIRVHGIYRSTGASFGKAKEEFAYGMVSDSFVRNTATSLFGGRQTVPNDTSNATR